MSIDGLQELFEVASSLGTLQERLQILLQCLFIGEGEILSTVFHKEVEGVDDGQVRRQVDLDPELAGLLGNDNASQEIAERVLLPVQKVLLGRHLDRVAEDWCPAMGSRSQADHLRPHADGTVIPIVGGVPECDANSHGNVSRDLSWELCMASEFTAAMARLQFRGSRRNRAESLPRAHSSCPGNCR